MKRKILTLAIIACLCSCEKIEDEIPPLPTAVETTLIQEHTQGNGVPIVIMADGYTLSDINDGTYRTATTKAVDAIFSIEPMASLKPYIDIIEVPLASSESGISTSAKETALKTYYSSGSDTNVYGDSTVIESKTREALAEVYGLSSTSEITSKLNSTAVLVLLNSSAYKGITTMNLISVSDSIPSGWTYSYVPVNAYYSTRGSVFTDLVQHELIGHGIAKLDEEYYSNSGASNTVISNYLLQKASYAIMMNTEYSTNTTSTYDIPSTSWIYPFTTNSLYDAEGLAWYRGAHNYGNNFFRPTYYSVMNSTTVGNNTNFNAPSRCMVYKAVMRRAYGSSWTYSLSDFISFDESGREEAASTLTQANAAGATDGTSGTQLDDDMPVLQQPRIYIKD